MTQSIHPTRRTFLKMSAGMAGMLTLAACAPVAVPAGESQSAEGAASAEVQTVQLATWTAAANLPVWQEAIDSLQENNPDTK